MKCHDKNEQCLLKFISLTEDSKKNPDIIEAIVGLGIKLKFRDSNPVYQIIDEMNYANLTRKHY